MVFLFVLFCYVSQENKETNYVIINKAAFVSRCPSQVFVVCFTVFGGLMAFNYHRELQAWVVPLLLVGFFAYLMSHSFLSVFEVTLDAMFLCFAIDMETNDGSAEKPYFVDQELLVSPTDNREVV